MSTAPTVSQDHAAVNGGPRRNASPITLPELLAAVQAAAIWAENAAECADEAITTLATIDAPLADRIEANRRRSERHRRNGAPALTNGHNGDVAVKLTSHGIVAECRRCGQRVVA